MLRRKWVHIDQGTFSEFDACQICPSETHMVGRGLSTGRQSSWEDIKATACHMLWKNCSLSILEISPVLDTTLNTSFAQEYDFYIVNHNMYPIALLSILYFAIHVSSLPDPRGGHILPRDTSPLIQSSPLEKRYFCQGVRKLPIPPPLPSTLLPLPLPLPHPHLLPPLPYQLLANPIPPPHTGPPM